MPPHMQEFSGEESATKSLQAAIDYTISQDYAAGHSAEQLRSLRGFHGEGNSNESILGSTVGNAPFSSQLSQHTRGNHALQDYQMQVMLLELQNKKRLLAARQEQETELEDRTQLQAERLEMSRKRQKLSATADDLVESLASTSAKPQTRHQERVGKQAGGSPVLERAKSKAHMAEPSSSHILTTTEQGTNSQDEALNYEVPSPHTV